MRGSAGARPGRFRRPLSFSTSLCVHGFILGWVALWPALPPPPPQLDPRFLQPHQYHIVWYKLSDRLPDVRPSTPAKDPSPPRATHPFHQNIVAGLKDNSHVPQLIWTPAPEIHTPKPLPLPNAVAVAPTAPPRPVRPFIAPPVPEPKLPTTPALPDTPEIATARPAGQLALTAPARPPARPFVHPAVPRAPDPTPALLPMAPDIQLETGAAALPSALTKYPKGFAPPPERPTPQAPAPLITAEAPALPSVDPNAAKASLAIVGLAPTKAPELPAPPGSRPAAFSAGPKPVPKGGSGGSDGTTLEVPGLFIDGGPKESRPVVVVNSSPTSKENLAAAAHAVPIGGTPPSPAGPRATRVMEAPDPRLTGRAVYTMAIQMPNITSYSGSWLVWFAQHETPAGDAPMEVQPPLALRIVDPKYIASAADERVEGKVRLWCVIGKDGTVGSVTLLSHLDDRLDRSAQEALSKWLFRPATVRGIPVELDAIFEVPFRLRPKPTR